MIIHLCILLHYICIQGWKQAHTYSELGYIEKGIETFSAQYKKV